MGLNDYGAAVGQYVFRFPEPYPETRILSGSGSARVFRSRMVDRLAEYEANLRWLSRLEGPTIPADLLALKGESLAAEIAAVKVAGTALYPFLGVSAAPASQVQDGD